MSRHASRSVRRAPVLAVIAGALVIGGLADRVGAPHVSAAVTAESVQPVPVAAPESAYSSSWFCAGASDASPNYAAGHVLISNAGSRAANGTWTLVPSQGAPVTGAITVPAHSTLSLAENVRGGAPWIGAVVDVDAGAVAVTQLVDGPLGRSSSPCATSGSSRWYLPTGQTRVNAAETLLLLNPYPADSIVDLSFSTDQGLENPQDFQGLDVPPGSLVAVPLGSHLRRRASIATNVSARTGNVVAWEAQVVTPPPKGAVLAGTPAAGSPLADPASPVAGVTVTLGAPSAGVSWVWPDGLAGPGLDEQYVIYNPGPGTAEVRLSVGLMEGSAEPFQISVGPYQVVPVISEQQARIPAGAPHTASLVSVNGVPVVAARSVAASKSPSNRSGLGLMLGERLASPAWLVAPAGVDGHHQGAVIVEDPGSGPVRFTVHGLPTGDQTLTAAPGGRAEIGVATAPTGPLTVTADGPVYVEFDLYGTGGTPGYGITTGVPLTTT